MYRKNRAVIFIGIMFFLLAGSSFASVCGQNQKNMNGNTFEVATFGGGCFWCTEAIFDRLEGVVDVISGYAGGEIKNPAYREVTSGRTGHAECVQITFDPAKISYADLLEIFWSTHDPTTLNQQGADVGTQYRSVIFTHNEVQKITAEAYLEQLSASKIWDAPVVTEIVPYSSFYPAEQYHQDYYMNNKEQAYCRIVITPKLKKFKKIFQDKLKKE